jgi:hypothetical protein
VSRSAPVATGRRRAMWAAPLIPTSGRHHRRPPPVSLPPLPPFDRRSSLLCSAPTASLPTNASHQRATFELSDQTKRSALSPRLSCAENLPAALAREAGQWEFPDVVFLREHPTGGSHLRLFPDPTDLATCCVPQGAPPYPLLQPPRPLLWPLTGASSPLTRAPP